MASELVVDELWGLVHPLLPSPPPLAGGLRLRTSGRYA